MILLIACVNVAGILLASLTLDILAANLPETMPSGSPATLNLRVLGATLALMACQADGFRRRASSVDPIESLRND